MEQLAGILGISASDGVSVSGEFVIAIVLIVAASAVAACIDLKRGRIPNALVLALLLCGLTVQASHGWAQPAIGLAIFFITLTAGLPLFSMKIMGGGDLKFMAAGAATLGWPNALLFLLFTLLAGGVLGAAYSIARRGLRPTVASMSALMFPMLSGARPATADVRAGTMPYALAIFAGAAIIALGNALDLHLRI